MNKSTPPPGANACPSYTDGIHRYERGRTWTAARRCCCKKIEPKQRGDMTLQEAEHGYREGY